MTDAIQRLLRGVASRIVAEAPGRWSVAVPGVATPVILRAADDWLLLERPLAAESPSALLGRSATTTGGARIVLAPDARVRADVVVDGALDLERRVGEACAGLALTEGRRPVPMVDAMLVARCRETSWPVDEREPGVVAVTLDVPDEMHVGTAVAHDDGSVVVGVDVAGPAASDVGREAIARLLLRTAGVVRMVRAASPARFEVVFASMPSGAELGHAFAALSVACRLAAREAAVLERDDTVAGAYVALAEGGGRCRLQ